MERHKKSKSSDLRKQIAAAVLVDHDGNFLLERAKTDDGDLAWRFVSSGIRRFLDNPKRASSRALNSHVGVDLSAQRQLHRPWVVPDDYYYPEEMRPSDAHYQAVLHSLRDRPKLYSNRSCGIEEADYLSLEEALKEFGEPDHNRPETDMGKIAVACAWQAAILRSPEREGMLVATLSPQPVC